MRAREFWKTFEKLPVIPSDALFIRHLVDIGKECD
ncbi:hypothetical protein SAMN05192563_101567 [Paraburkholderia aspalathi]|uniref:Uncharacterized protein n=1 Tax=Paraburkholderia aspalathi TaxID=1324617 RepID=A0A1I7E9P3_9BURK|nr:hypothetical protein SAMN05192563_101567 [Paraburkholderia aspalathi]